MASAKIYFQMDVSLPGGLKHTIGDKSSPVVVPLDSSTPQLFTTRIWIADNVEGKVLNTNLDFPTEDINSFKLAAFRPSVDMILSWYAGTTADNSALAVRANTWFIMTSESTVPYVADALTRIDNTAVADNIEVVYAANNSGATGYVDVVAVY